MIFVTLGTQDKGFPRLLEAIEDGNDFQRDVLSQQGTL